MKPKRVRSTKVVTKPSTGFVFTLWTIRNFGELMDARPWIRSADAPDLRMVQEAAALALGLYRHIEGWYQQDVDDPMDCEHAEWPDLVQRQDEALRAWYRLAAPLITDIASGWPAQPPSQACLELSELVRATEAALAKSEGLTIDCSDVAGEAELINQREQAQHDDVYGRLGERIRRLAQVEALGVEPAESLAVEPPEGVAEAPKGTKVRVGGRRGPRRR